MRFQELDCAVLPKSELGHASRTVGNALGYEQSPGKGQKAAPNLAVEEQPRAPTWATELAIANASLPNRLLHSKGPATGLFHNTKGDYGHLGGGRGLDDGKSCQTYKLFLISATISVGGGRVF